MISVLTIGNSLAENATKFLEQMTEADGEGGLLVGKMNLGGCSLEKHWNLVEQCDMLPGVKPYHFRLTGCEPREATLREALASHPWDYVTLQQVSNLSWQLETYYPYINNLYRLIRELAPQAQPVIHQTWAYHIDSPLMKQWGITQEEMYVKLREAYATVAREFNCPIIPCGTAFQKAQAVMPYTVDPHFNFADPKPLELPEQSKSLIVGYFWRTGNTPSGKAEFHIDERHANDKGCYLAGAVWYEMLTGREIARNPFHPEGVTVEELDILKRAAHEAVVEYGGPLRRLC
ncbi:MAG TPA: DUF4886 domain-containing protein [Firmicutes bacterium]|nr:DUF4886 domain-containing protein [Bacillota bacterium]